MQKQIIRLALLTALAWGLALGSPPAHAQMFPGYTSGLQVQNLDGEEAAVTLTFYDAGGGVDTVIEDTIAANGSKTYFGATLTVSEGFNGSAVVSSNRRIAAISNLFNHAFTAGASFIASDAGATTVLLPLLQANNSGFEGWVVVQNAGDGPADVRIDYSDGVVATATIPPGASRTFYQREEAHPFSGALSGMITSDQPVAAMVVQESTETIFAYTGFTAGSTHPVMPLINFNGGFVTGAQIQNAGDTDTTVTVTYTPAIAGEGCTETQEIPAGQSRTFTLAAFSSGAHSTCLPGQRFVGAGQVTANSAGQPLVAIVNQLSMDGAGEAYGGFDPASATNRVVMPLIMDRNSGFFTGFNVMNVGATAAEVTCTFTGAGYTVSDTLAPGSALTDLQAMKIGEGYVGSGVCTAGDGGQIVGVVNELSQAGGDRFLVYEGINN